MVKEGFKLYSLVQGLSFLKYSIILGTESDSPGHSELDGSPSPYITNSFYLSATDLIIVKFMYSLILNIVPSFQSVHVCSPCLLSQVWSLHLAFCTHVSPFHVLIFCKDKDLVSYTDMLI